MNAQAYWPERPENRKHKTATIICVPVGTLDASRSSRLARLSSTSTFECPEERSINLCKTLGIDLVLVQRDKPTPQNTRRARSHLSSDPGKLGPASQGAPPPVVRICRKEKTPIRGICWGARKPWGEHACERRHPFASRPRYHATLHDRLLLTVFYVMVACTRGWHSKAQ